MAKARTIKIDITAANKAGNAITSVVNALRGVGGAAEGAAPRMGILQGALSTAFGFGIFNGIRKISDSILGIGRSAIAAVSDIQALEISLEALLAEKAMFEEVNKTRQIAIHLTDKEKQKVVDLNLKYETLRATMQEMKQRIIQNTQKYGEQGLVVIKQKGQLAEMANRHRKIAEEIDNLVGKEGQLVTVTDTRIMQVMDYSQALELSKSKVVGIMNAMTKLALESPFGAQEVRQVAQMGLQYGLAETEVVSFTRAFLDYAAAHPVLGKRLTDSAAQFLEMRAAMNLTKVDMRQLMTRGLDVEKILRLEIGTSAEELEERFGKLTAAGKKLFTKGMSVEEFNKKIKKSPELMDALFQKFTLYSEKTTAGAAKRMGETVAGMMSTVTDIIKEGSGTLFKPIVEAVSPMLAEVLGKISGFVGGGALAAKGREIGKRISDGLESFLSSDVAGKISKVGGALKIFFKLLNDRKRDVGIFEALQKALEWVVPKNVVDSVIGFLKQLDKLGKTAAGLVRRGLSAISKWFDRNGPNIAKMGERIGIALAIIFDKLTMTGKGAGSWVETIVDFLLSTGLTVIGALVTLLELLAKHWTLVENAIIGFATILAGGVIVSSIGKFMRMFNPMYLILLAVGTAVKILAKAWIEDWGGIKSALLDAWEKMKPVADAILDFIGGLKGIIKTDDIDAGLAAKVEGLADALLKLGVPEWVVERIAGVADAIAPLLAALDALFVGDYDEAISNFSLAIGEFFQGILGLDEKKVEDISKTLSPFFQSFKSISEGKLSDAVLNFATGIGKFAENILGVDSGAAMNLALSIKSIGDNALLAAPSVFSFIERMALMERLDLAEFSAALDLVGRAFDFIKGALEELNVALQATINLLFPGVDIAKEFEEGMAGPAVALSGFDKPAQNAIGALESLKPVFDALLQDGASIGDLFDAVVQAWDTDVERMYGPLGKMKDATTGTFLDLRNELIEYSIVPDMISDIVLAFQGLAVSVATALEGFVLTVTTPFTAASLAITGIFQTLETELVGTTIPSLVGGVAGALSSIPSLAADAIRTKLSVLEKIGEEIVGGIKKGIEDNWETFQEWVANQIGGLVQSILDSLGIKSPSKVFVGIGSDMADGLQEGWSDAFGSFQKNVAGSAKKMAADLPGNIMGNTRPATARAMDGYARQAEMLTQGFGNGIDRAGIGQGIEDSLSSGARLREAEFNSSGEAAGVKWGEGFNTGVSGSLATITNAVTVQVLEQILAGASR